MSYVRRKAMELGAMIRPAKLMVSSVCRVGISIASTANIIQETSSIIGNVRW